MVNSQSETSQLRLSIVGMPNVGKSSLTNTLLQKDRSRFVVDSLSAFMTALKGSACDSVFRFGYCEHPYVSPELMRIQSLIEAALGLSLLYGLEASSLSIRNMFLWTISLTYVISIINIPIYNMIEPYLPRVCPREANDTSCIDRLSCGKCRPLCCC